jgi:hypothetical protein
LLTFSRLPSEDERAIGLEVLAQEGVAPRQAIADLLWALINSAEFVFKD